MKRDKIRIKSRLFLKSHRWWHSASLTFLFLLRDEMCHFNLWYLYAKYLYQAESLKYLPLVWKGHLDAVDYSKSLPDMQLRCLQ